MGKNKNFNLHLIFLSLILSAFLLQNSLSQPVVGIDNWYNHETNAKTGKPYHYLWSDTAWSGYSRWGKIFIDKGAVISHVIEAPTPTILDHFDIYIIVDPDTSSENPSPNYIKKGDAQAIEQWVKKGGVLVLLGNDAPNCEFTHLNLLAGRFGIQFNHVTLRQVINDQFEMGAFTRLPHHPIFRNVHKIFLKEISSLTLSKQAKAILIDDTNVIMAESKSGKGYVFAAGDPWIYNEYIDHDRLPAGFENRKAAENLTEFLLKKAKH